VNLGLLPATGMGEPRSSFWDQASHLILPTLALAVVPAGLIARSVRSTVGEILNQEFVQTLYANGLPPLHVFHHVIKNAAPPALAVIGLEFARLLGGSILVETVFSWPGTGFLLNSAIFMRDLPVVQGTVLVLAMFFVLTNVLVDILQMIFDPRFKRARVMAGASS
jgi:peptide/nickel transport system permease protein